MPTAIRGRPRGWTKLVGLLVPVITHPVHVGSLRNAAAAMAADAARHSERVPECLPRSDGSP